MSLRLARAFGKLPQPLLASCHAAAWVQAGDLEDSLPTIDPVVSKERTRCAAATDLLYEIRLSLQARQHSGDVGSIWFDLGHRVRPVEQIAEHV